MTDSNHYDTIIIGAGPAGATAATVLTEHGRRVVVLEKDKFPRYRLGESLLPYCYFTLERLGMIDKLNANGYVKKYSVPFVNLEGRISAPFYFVQHMNHSASQTWQVERSRFDQMMIDNAVSRGAEVRFGTAARHLLTDGDAVTGVALDDGAELRAPVTIDASGRDAFAIARNDWRVRDEYLRKIAIWTYFRGAVRDPGRDEGATTIAYLPEKGWFWYIPLRDDMVSVGIVAEQEYLYRGGRDPEAILQREIPVNSWIAEHLATAEQVEPVRVTSDFSYRSRYCAADGLVLAGDAFAFLDPVFSSGVFLALKSGEMAGDAIHEALDAGDVRADRFTDYGERFCDGVEAMRKLVYAFYDQTFSFGKMLKKHPKLRGDLTDCLIGHLYRDLDPLFKAVAEFAQVPPPLAHGRPKVTVG